MIKVHNDIIPFKGYKALTAWPFLFIRSDLWRWTDEDERHENIHGEQQKEMLPIGIALAVILFPLGCGWWSLIALPLYFVWYVAEWAVRIILMGFKGKWYNLHKAYRSISFEQEAYFFETDTGYLDRRTHFLWLRYLLKKYNN